MANFESKYVTALRMLFVPVVLALIVVSCATSDPSIRDTLDPMTGVTVRTVGAPLVLYRENPSQAAFAKTFVNVGPIEVNRSGYLRYYIWLGVWQTMMRTDLASYRDRLESTVIFADGEPIFLEFAGWLPEAIGTSEAPYLKPVANTVDAYYFATADQIRMLTEAIDIRLQTGGTKPLQYQAWDDQSLARADLDEFVHARIGVAQSD